MKKALALAASICASAQTYDHEIEMSGLRVSDTRVVLNDGLHGKWNRSGVYDRIRMVTVQSIGTYGLVGFECPKDGPPYFFADLDEANPSYRTLEGDGSRHDPVRAKWEIFDKTIYTTGRLDLSLTGDRITTTQEEFDKIGTLLRGKFTVTLQIGHGTVVHDEMKFSTEGFQDALKRCK